MTRSARLLVAAVLLLLGLWLWLLGREERALVARDRELVTLRFAGPAADVVDPGPLSRVLRTPWISRRSPMEERERQRSTARYWAGHYDTLLARSASDDPGRKTDPALLMLAVNAAFRRVQPHDDDWRVALPRLAEVLDGYAEVMRLDPGNLDAAYNYEYVARLRDRITHGRPTSPGSTGRGTGPGANPRGPEAHVRGNSTLHGRPGAPMLPPDMNKFHIVVPLSGDERRDQPDLQGATGQKKRRKG